MKGPLNCEDILEMLCEMTSKTRDEILEAVRVERARMVKEKIIKTFKTAHGDIDYMDHPLLEEK